MDDDAAKTLMTYHGYAWGKKSRNERTIFDYVKGLARIRKETPEESREPRQEAAGGDQRVPRHPDRDLLPAPERDDDQRADADEHLLGRQGVPGHLPSGRARRRSSIEGKQTTARGVRRSSTRRAGRSGRAA